MVQQTVSSFTTPYICFMRMHKKTFCILAYQRFNNPARADRWYPCTHLNIDPQHLTIHRSNRHTYEASQGAIIAGLRIGSRFAGPANLVQYTLDGEYLKWAPPEGATVYIPILKRRILGETWKASFTKHDHRRNPDQNLGNYTEYYTDQHLWNLRNINIQENNQAPPPLVQRAPRFTPAPIVKSIPARIANLIAEDAFKREEICPITMEPITVSSCKVTSCYHVFESSAIDHWLTTNTTCPVCKQTCSVTAPVC